MALPRGFQDALHVILIPLSNVESLVSAPRGQIQDEREVSYQPDLATRIHRSLSGDLGTILATSMQVLLPSLFLRQASGRYQR